MTLTLIIYHLAAGIKNEISSKNETKNAVSYLIDYPDDGNGVEGLS